MEERGERSKVGLSSGRMCLYGWRWSIWLIWRGARLGLVLCYFHLHLDGEVGTVAIVANAYVCSVVSADVGLRSRGDDDDNCVTGTG